MSLQNISLVTFHEGRERNSIPDIVHLIFVKKNAVMPDNIRNWKTVMTDHPIRVWTSDDINDSEFGSAELIVINKAPTDEEKSRIMRFFILQKYGGIFIDYAMTPFRSLDPIFYIPNLQVALAHSDDITNKTKDISIDMIACTPAHTFITLCCALLSWSKSPFSVIGEVLRQQPKFDGFGILPVRYFYKNLKGQVGIDGSVLTKNDDVRFATML